MIKNPVKIVKFIEEKIKKLTDIAVIGLSGGADSTLVAILCSEALGKENVWGISMPYSETDRTLYNAASERIAKKIGINHLMRNIKEIVDAINERIYINTPSELTLINAGNSRARVRMCILYGIASTLSNLYKGKRVRVVGTGNLSERYIGYSTKGGDNLADFFPIGDLFKSEVYQLLDYFASKGVISDEDIDRVPTAALYPSQTDESELGYSYNEMEKAIRYCLKNKVRKKKLNKVISFVWDRHIKNLHKNKACYVIKLRHLYEWII